MSSQPMGNNTPPPPQDGGSNGGEPAEQVTGDQPLEELVEEGNEEGEVAIGAQSPEGLDGEDTNPGDESDGDEGEFGEEPEANEGVQDQQGAPGAADEPTNEEDIAALIRPVTAGWIKIDGRYEEHETFVPLPKITFLINRPDNLTCRLCRVSELRIPPEVYLFSDRTPAIMPCGHIAGAECLDHALESMEPGDWACPFCRYPLKYTECEHRVPEKALTPVAIRTMPATVPNGGVVPPLCAECRVISAEARYHFIMTDAQTDVMVARANYAVNGTDEAARQLAEFARLFERLPVEEAEEISEIRSGIGAW